MWTDELADKEYRKTYEHPDIIKCADCEYLNKYGSCSNIYSYPTMPEGFGCKNGRVKCENKSNQKYSILDKLKCKLGFHRERIVGKSNPYCQEVLLKCDCCGKYGLWHTGINCVGWCDEKDKEKYLSKSCLDMIDKYNL